MCKYLGLRPIGATAARQIPVLKVTRSNRVSVTLSLVRGVAERYTHRHGFHKVMKAVDEVVDDKIAYFARSCNYTYNLGYQLTVTSPTSVNVRDSVGTAMGSSMRCCALSRQARMVSGGAGARVSGSSGAAGSSSNGDA